MPQSHNLSVSASPSSGGTVVSNPAGISCGGTCTTPFVDGTSVALTVLPAQGFAFTGWGGSCSGNGGCSIAMSADHTVVANFGPPPIGQITLSVNSSGDGTGTISSNPAGINCSNCSTAVQQGTTITLSATPDPGSTFTGWSGANCLGTAACTINANGSTSVTAVFSQLVTVGVSLSNVGGTGSGSVSSFPAGIDCPSVTCSSPFPSGTVVSFAAKPDPGFVFQGWSGACSGTGPCTLTMSTNLATTNVAPGVSAKKINLNASFSVASYNLSTTISTTGTAAGQVTSPTGPLNCTSGTCTLSYTSGTSVTLTAAPTNANTVFAGWSGSSCAGTGTCTVTVSANTSVTAKFLPLFTLSATTLGTGGATGTVTSSDGVITNCATNCSDPNLASGTVIGLAATPGPNSVFTGWSGACTTSAPCSVTMSSNQSVTANFAPLFPLSVALSGSGSVTSADGAINCGTACTANYPSGTTVVLTPTAAAGNVFSAWSGPCTVNPTTQACSVLMSQAQSVTATFIPNSFTVTVAGAGTGTGTVTGTGSINCTSTAGTTGAGCVSSALASQTPVTLQVSNVPVGSVFAGWSGCPVTPSGNQCGPFFMPASNTTVTATFSTAPQVNLSVAMPGSGSGTVTSSSTSNQGTQINCTAVAGVIQGGSVCTVPFFENDQVTLHESVGSSSVFTSWSSTSISCPVGASCGPITVGSSPISVSATFTQEYSLSITTAGTGSALGSVTCNNTTCAATYDSVTSVDLRPVAQKGAAFAGWGAGACSGTSAVPCTVTMTSNQSATANFNAISISVTSAGASTGTGKVTILDNNTAVGCNNSALPCSSGNNSLLAGDSIKITATPDTNMVFTGWGGACSGTGDCLFTMGNSALAVTAQFDQAPKYTVQVNKSGTGTVVSTDAGPTINCGTACASANSQYFVNTSVTLHATPAAGFAFAGWSNACTGTTDCQLTSSTTQTLTAVATFVPTTITVLGAGASTGSGIVTGSANSTQVLSCSIAVGGATTP
ncbi:MAG: InlB B-repeat-containing protein, partial [Terriglobales bacterium]